MLKQDDINYIKKKLNDTDAALERLLELNILFRVAREDLRKAGINLYRIEYSSGVVSIAIYIHTDNWVQLNLTIGNTEAPLLRNFNVASLDSIRINYIVPYRNIIIDFCKDMESKFDEIVSNSNFINWDI